MLHLLLKTKRFIPSEFHNSFFDIDFKVLKEHGYRTILCDLDNTLISYDEDLPTKEILDVFKNLEELDLEIILISNNVTTRIENFINGTNVKGFANARKPLLSGVNKALSVATVQDKDKVVLIGDQLMTDIFAANRFNVYSILVNPIKKKTEKWYTRMNRRTEEKMLKKIAKHYPNKYKNLALDKRV